MRKTLLVIAALFTTAQVFAATATLEVNDIGDGWASIRYSAIDANVSAFGLRVTADSGAIFTDINDYNVGECTASVQGYGIFPGTIDINEDGTVDDNGLPYAPNTAPGANDTGLNTNALVLEMGALYVEGNEPDASGTLIKVKVDGDCNVCVEGESIRGNVVLTDGTSVDPCASCVSVSVACYTGPDYDEWVTVGKPDSWCYPRQCHGDADGEAEQVGKTTYWVSHDDLIILIEGYTKEYGGNPDVDTWIAADFDHAAEAVGKTSYRVSHNDLLVLVEYYTQEVVPTDCLD